MLVQDTGWPGYEADPGGWIVEGYSHAVRRDRRAVGLRVAWLWWSSRRAWARPRRQATVTHYRSRRDGAAATALLSVEPVPTGRALCAGRPRPRGAGQCADGHHHHGRSQLRHRLQPGVAPAARRVWTRPSRSHVTPTARSAARDLARRRCLGRPLRRGLARRVPVPR
ncbi:hypothetical protein ACRAWF_27670 [Streptomyces sp. L7]